MPQDIDDILLSSFFFADQYPSIQACVQDAGKTGVVFIPPDYPGADSYSNPNRLVIFDLRPGRFVVDVAHGGRPPVYPFGLGLAVSAPRPPYLSAAPLLSTPLGWFASTAILN